MVGVWAICKFKLLLKIKQKFILIFHCKIRIKTGGGRRGGDTILLGNFNRLIFN